MKTALLTALCFALLTGNKEPQEQWLYFNEVHVDKAERCPDTKLEVVLRNAGKDTKLNKLYDIKVRIDEATKILVFVDSDSVAAFSPAAWCYPSLEYSPFIVDVKYSGNCNDCFKTTSCYLDLEQTNSTPRSTTSAADSLAESGGIDLCAKNYIHVTLRGVNATLGKVIYEEIE